MKAQTMFAIVYQVPGPYSEFLSEFSEFLSALVLKTDKVIIVGDINIHVDIENENTEFLSLLDSLGFCQCVCETTHTLYTHP